MAAANAAVSPTAAQAGAVAEPQKPIAAISTTKGTVLDIMVSLLPRDITLTGAWPGSFKAALTLNRRAPSAIEVAGASALNPRRNTRSSGPDLGIETPHARPVYRRDEGVEAKP